jgi:hypothetical protein
MRKRHFSIGCLVVVFVVIGLVIFANIPASGEGQPLNEDQMDSIHGGFTCGPCIYDLEYDCPAGYGQECKDKSVEDCEGYYRTSCEQLIKICPSVDWLPCDPYQKDCENSMEYYRCEPEYDIIKEEWYCGETWYATLNCDYFNGSPQTKDWCD